MCDAPTSVDLCNLGSYSGGHDELLQCACLRALVQAEEGTAHEEETGRRDGMKSSAGSAGKGFRERGITVQGDGNECIVHQHGYLTT